MENKISICVLDAFTLNPGDLNWDELNALGNTKIFDRTMPEQIFERAKGCEVVITNKTVIDKNVIDGLKDMKYVGVLATGYNVVDCSYASEKGIVVTNIPAYGTDAVAQFTFALILELCHRVGYHSGSVTAGDWTKSKDFCYWNFPLTELSGKTFGVIGFGKIGSRAAEIAASFGMKVLAYSRTKRGVSVTNDIQSNVRFGNLEEVLKQSDILSLHCPMLPSTQEIINAGSLAKMKKNAFLINTSRGGLINEFDLADALNNQKLAGYAADVLSSEPPKATNPLLKAKNAIITPHIAWAAKESRARLMKAAISNIKAYINGKPENVVN